MVSVTSPSRRFPRIPLNEEASTTMTPTTATTTTQKPSELSILSSTARTISQVHTSATSVPKVASHTGTMPTVKFDTLADDTATTTSATSMIPTASVTTKQSSNLANPPTVASLPVVATESPIISFGRHTVSPIEFQSGKFTAPGSYYITSGAKNKAQQSLLTYLLAQQGKTTLKSNEQNPLLNYVVLPPVMTNSLNNKIQNPVSSYVHPEEGKSALKDSLLNYMLQQEPNHGLSVQQSSLPETVNYVPLTNTYAERPKLSLSSLPFSTLSAVPRPMETINYVSATVPRVSGFATQDTSPSAAFPLGSSLDVLNSATSLPSSLGTGFTQSQSPSIFSSLPAGLNGGISAGIPGSLSATVPGSLSTLSLGQNFQHLGHLRQFEPARSQPLSYSPGLQLQLGGYGGIDYTLRPSNPAPRPLELGIAKVGLSLPEFPRQQLPAFSKFDPSVKRLESSASNHLVFDDIRGSLNS
ncbi:hypothetical protein WN55_07116 [Dufourea novaeangliae]|uniref:Uncharacterized protein n=1 Tax=Dufourea novaeangliae TaxID=178035 RepID=A0A154P4I4_DUFNO|nr:hypothetical protein WN55_07116 [Dufourea novaeangliae]